MTTSTSAIPESRDDQVTARVEDRSGSKLDGVHVVFLTNSMMVGGMEAHVEVLVRGLIRRGISVTVVCPDDEAIRPFRDALSAAGADVHMLTASRRSPILLVKRLVGLWALLRKQRPFILHVHITGSDGGTLPMVAAKLASARALVRTEHLPPDESISSRRRFLILLRDLWLDRVICVSQANENQYATMGRNREKLVTVHNSVEPERFGQHNAREKVRRLIDATDQTIAIGAISRMSEERKGLHHFVEMATTLSREDDRLRFFLAGDGPLRASVEKAAGESIVFLGEVPRRRRHAAELDVTDCYAAMDIFVQPSLSEGGPITVLEAMASGLPIVSTDVGMVKEAITDGIDGLIVPPADTKALADAVESLCRDPDRARRMGETARKTVQQRFGEDVMIEKTLRVYGAVV